MNKSIRATALLSLVTFWGTAIAQDEAIQFHEFESTVMQGSPPAPADVVTVHSFESNRQHRVWAQQHMRELMSTQAVHRGSGRPSELKRNTDHALINKMQVADGEGQRITVEKLLRKADTDAFLVMHRGRILTEQYSSGMRPDSLHCLYSLSKPIAVGVVFNLLAEGKLEEDLPIDTYIEELKGSAYKGATVRHLMDMQSGVHYQYSQPRIRDDEIIDPGRLHSMHEDGVHYRSAGLLPRRASDPFASQYEFLPTLKLRDRPHGEIFSYKCSDTCVLAWACERVTGKRFSDLVSEYIWSKLGAEHDASMIRDSKGAAAPNGGMSATLRDLARWGQMHIHGGHYNGHQILPKRYVDDLLENADPDKVTEDSSGAVSIKGFAYRSQYPVLLDSRAYFPGGAWGQYCFIDPESETVIVKFATSGLMNLIETEIRAFQEIARQLLEKGDGQDNAATATAEGRGKIVVPRVAPQNAACHSVRRLFPPAKETARNYKTEWNCTPGGGLIVPHKCDSKKNQESGPKAFQAVDRSWTRWRPTHNVCGPGCVDLRST